jgi:hypothetical protein
MKTWLYFAAGVVVGAVVMYAVIPKSGRYRLEGFPGTVIRLDTATGASWEWAKGWERIKEP